MKSVSRAVAVVILGASAILALAGCVNGTPTKPTGTPTTPASSASPSPTPTSTPSATPVTFPCTTVLTAQQVYDYNPNYVAKDSYKPGAGSDAASVVAASGIACGWVDETSGSILSVAIAQPAAVTLQLTQQLAAAGNSPISLTGSAVGYFSSANGVGELQVFTHTYWIVISSSDFSAASDVSPTAKLVLGNLPSP